AAGGGASAWRGRRPAPGLVGLPRYWARAERAAAVIARIDAVENPEDARVAARLRLFAVLGTWMEADVVADSVRNAFAQGCERVYLVDNGSEDDTVARAVEHGAILARTFVTEHYDERLRLRLMNDVVTEAST